MRVSNPGRQACPRACDRLATELPGMMRVPQHADRAPGHPRQELADLLRNVLAMHPALFFHFPLALLGPAAQTNIAGVVLGGGVGLELFGPGADAGLILLIRLEVVQTSKDPVDYVYDCGSRAAAVVQKAVLQARQPFLE